MTAKHQSMSAPSGSENRLFRNQSDQVFSEVPAERTLQDFGKHQIWQKIGKNLKRYDFHVEEVTKPILSVSYLCEHGIETHLAGEPFLKCGDRRELLIKRNGVYFVKASCVQAGDSQNHAYEQEIHKIGEYEHETHKSHEYEQETHKSHEYVRKFMREVKIHKSGTDELKIPQKSCRRAEDSAKVVQTS